MKNHDYTITLENVGRRLKTLREERRETLCGVAQATGLEAMLLCKIENGNFFHLSLSSLVLLCCFYNCKLHHLFQKH
jgi:transcriptional regulator with XRE-family HTH domain